MGQNRDLAVIGEGSQKEDEKRLRVSIPKQKIIMQSKDDQDDYEMDDQFM